MIFRLSRLFIGLSIVLEIKQITIFEPTTTYGFVNYPLPEGVTKCWFLGWGI